MSASDVRWLVTQARMPRLPATTTGPSSATFSAINCSSNALCSSSEAPSTAKHTAVKVTGAGNVSPGVASMPSPSRRANARVRAFASRNAETPNACSALHTLKALKSRESCSRAIIRHLQEDGRLTNTELADKVGLTPSPCLRRVRALEEAGVITGYHAAVDPVALGRGFRVLLHIDLHAQDLGTIEAFEARIAEIDAVESCVRMFGQPDYHLWIAVADIAAYERLYMSALTTLPGVARTNSQFPMKTVLPR